MVGLIVEIAVVGLCGNKAIVILLRFAIIDRAVAAETLHKVINSLWHSQYRFGSKRECVHRTGRRSSDETTPL
jgi:hypothetical protein